MMLRIDMSRLSRQLEELARFGRDSKGGVTRFSLSPVFLEARSWLESKMSEAGVQCRVDEAGNLIGRSGGGGPAILVGSHIDTAPSGGMLDGAYGILAGLECVRVIRESKADSIRPIEICCFLDEHGRFLDCLGSKAMTGQLIREEVLNARSPDGQSLSEALIAAGLDPKRIFDAARPTESIAAYLELHIEQGPVLDAVGSSIGIVDRIAGILRRDFTFHGIANHAGQTPHNSKSDAMRAACEFVVRSFSQAEHSSDGSVRMNFGMIECLPGATSTIPGYVRIRQEIRHPDVERLRTLANESHEIAFASARDCRVNMEVSLVGKIEGTRLSSELAEQIFASAHYLGVSSMALQSGTGHDAQVMAQVAPTGLIFVPSRYGRSHCPAETTKSADLEAGANVLLSVLLGLVSKNGLPKESSSREA